MSVSLMTDADVRKAEQIWAEYQKQHDVSDRNGQAVGIDPVSGRVCFGESIEDIANQLEAEGIAIPALLRVGGVRLLLPQGPHSPSTFCER